jgi:2-polyprenyl-3-methyl-5-hydroxy-6-metoxy-1,4-benzoquinol methylase
MNILAIGKTNPVIHGFLKYVVDKKGIAIYETTDMDNIITMISDNNITHVLFDHRKGYGNNIWNTSYIENKLDANLNYNLFNPLVVCDICNRMNVHLTYIGDGCIFRSEKSIEPDLKVSKHSIVNIYTEKLLRRISDNMLYLRIRYPITKDMKPHCYLMKLISYNKIIDVDNSVTFVPDVLHIVYHMMENKIIGTFNLCSNYVNSIDLILKLGIEFDTHIDFKLLSREEHNKVIGERSNCIMDNSNLIEYCDDNNLTIKDTRQLVDDVIHNMVEICKELHVCLCCQQRNTSLLNLGYQPLANDYHDNDRINEIFPLRLKYCQNCYHSQLSHSVSPGMLFRNYKYVSGTSNTGRQFFEENAKFIHDYKGKCGKVLDIACNDGSQLNPFKILGWETYGVDPAENICPIAEKYGHKIICAFWTDDIANELPVMDVITAQNVFAHTPYIDAFLQSCKLVMDKNTSLFIQTSQRDMILNGEFDTIYHEHISFFNTKSMDVLTQRNGLVLNKVTEHSIHGRSYIFEIKLDRDDSIYDIDKHLEIENNIGLYNVLTYKKFQLNAEKSISNLILTVDKYVKEGYKAIGFGAAAKGQTVLCYGNIDLEYIIDESPLKIGTYTPKLNIPIVPIKHFVDDEDDKFLIIILAWNFAKEIKQKIYCHKENKNVIVIEKYFPKIIIS